MSEVHFMGLAGENMESLSDKELIEKYKKTKDKVLIGVLYKRYSHLVYGMCLRYFHDRDESKDGVIRIFEKLFQELAKREIDNFKIWLTFVSRNFCISELRKRKTENEREQAFVREGMIQEDREEIFYKEILLQNIEQAMEQLKPEQKFCVELFYIKEKSYREIAEITGYALSDVKTYLQNGKRNLKLRLLDKRND